MATAIIKAALPGVPAFTGLTAYFFTHPGTQNAAPVVSAVSLTADSDSNHRDVYWGSINMASVAVGRYEVVIKDSNGNRVGFGYIYLTNTANVHVVVDDPWMANAAGTVVSSDYGGVGAWTVTLTITDGSAVPIQGARVRVTQGLETYALTTNASGVVVFGLDNGSWTVTATKALYTTTSDFNTPLSVSANTSQTYRMTGPTVVTPADDPDFCIVRITCWENGATKSGLTVYLRVYQEPSSDTGNLYTGDTQSDVTGGDGIATFTVPRGSYVEYKGGDGAWKRALVPTDADVVSIASHVFKTPA